MQLELFSFKKILRSDDTYGIEKAEETAKRRKISLAVGETKIVIPKLLGGNVYYTLTALQENAVLVMRTPLLCAYAKDQRVYESSLYNLSSLYDDNNQRLTPQNNTGFLTTDASYTYADYLQKKQSDVCGVIVLLDKDSGTAVPAPALLRR